MEMAENEAMNLGDRSEEKITTFKEDLEIIMTLAASLRASFL